MLGWENALTDGRCNIISQYSLEVSHFRTPRRLAVLLPATFHCVLTDEAESCRSPSSVMKGAPNSVLKGPSAMKLAPSSFQMHAMSTTSKRWMLASRVCNHAEVFTALARVLMKSENCRPGHPVTANSAFKAKSLQKVTLTSLLCPA